MDLHSINNSTWYQIHAQANSLIETGQSVKIRNQKSAYHAGYRDIHIQFGQYAGKTVYDVFLIDRGYFEYMIRGGFRSGNERIFIELIE